MDDLAVRTEGLEKRYGPVIALAGLDLEVPRRSLFGFLGPNGAGKTTAIRLLLGLSRPTGGRGTVLGFDIVEDSLPIRQRVGYLPQHPRFHDELSARETLRYARGFFPKDADRRVEDDITEVLDLVGLARQADRRSGQLSGGQLQRLGIAQAQIHRPELLILDEPASALDPGGRRDVLEVLRRLKETTTVFFSTHILDDVQRVSDTVAILKDGSRVIQAPIDDLLLGAGVVYALRLAGPVEAPLQRLRAEPWVADVRARQRDGVTEAEVAVTDEAAARRQLLRLMLSGDDVEVEAFARRRSELEDVFLDIMEGAGR